MLTDSEAHLESLLDIIVASARQAIAEYKKGSGDAPTIHSKAFHPLDFAEDTVALKGAVTVLEGACQQLCAALAPPQVTVNNFVNPLGWACMNVAVRAKVADALEKYPNGLHADELAKLVNLEKGKLARVVRFLVSKGYFIEVEPNIFANNRVSLAMVSTSDTGAYTKIMTENTSQGAFVLYETMTDPEYATSYHPERSPMRYALRKKGIEGNYFDMLKEDDEKRKVGNLPNCYSDRGLIHQQTFHRAMIGITRAMGFLAVLHYYPWNEVSTVCDVGAGIGAICQPLAKMHSHLKIVLQDLPEVIAQAKNVWGKESPEVLQNNRVEFVSLNFLEESPVHGQDVYYMRAIIHDWADADAVIILTNVRKAMAPHSRLLIHDMVLPPAGINSNARALRVTPSPLLPSIGNRGYEQDIAMWVQHNAKERTLEEVIALGSSVGLKLENIYDLANSAVLEFKLPTT